jgi:hypothetical protein
MKKMFIGVCLALALPVCAHAASVDFSSWTNDGTGSWTILGANDNVRGPDGNPGVFLSGNNDQNTRLSGNVTVGTSSDDDYFGFVVGYEAGDGAITGANYLLIDWKQTTQSFFGCDANAGLAVSQVSGLLQNGSGIWCHDSGAGVAELFRGDTLGATGWGDNTTYAFEIDYTPTEVTFRINGAWEFAVTGSIPAGSFGLYTYSQSFVEWTDVTQESLLPPVPVPTSLPLMAGALGLLALARRRSRKA